MKAFHIHLKHLMYSNSPSEPGLGQKQPSLLTGTEVKQILKDDLVFEAAVQIFVWKHNRVQYDHLRRNGHVAT